VFSNEATYHVHGTANRPSFRINPLEVIKHGHVSAKVVWCAVINNIIGSLSSEETKVTGEMFFAVMEVAALCHIPAGTVFPLLGSPSYFFRPACVFLDREFSDCWKGSPPPTPRSSDLTALNVFLLGLVKCIVYKKKKGTK
jgi:hypothetical protein